MIFFIIVVLGIILLHLNGVTLNTGRPSAKRRPRLTARERQADPYPDLADDTDAFEETVDEDLPLDAAPQPVTPSDRLRSFYRTVHGPGLCSPKGADTTTP